MASTVKIFSSLARVLRALAPHLAPLSNPVEIEGFDELLIHQAGRILFEMTFLSRWGFFVAFFLFEWLPFLFGFGWKTFSHLSEKKKVAYVANWAKSRLRIKREFFKVMRALVLLIYYSDPRVWRYIGYDPNPHMQEKIRMREKIIQSHPERSEGSPA